MTESRFKVGFALIAALVLVLAGLGYFAEAKPLAIYYNQRIYENLTRPLVTDFKSAGFSVEVGEQKDVHSREESSIVEIEVKIKEAPPSFKKYFGDLKAKTFYIQADETNINDFVIRVWLEQDNGINNQVYYSSAKNFSDYEKEASNIKKSLIFALYGYDCQYGGGFYTKNPNVKNLFFVSSGKSRAFSKEMDEFLNNLYKELKDFDFKFTLVENPPKVEIRFFGFPKAVSGFLPEPETKLILVESVMAGNKEGERAVIEIFDRSKKKFSNFLYIDLWGSPSLKEKAKSSVKGLFRSFYIPPCPPDAYGI